MLPLACLPPCLPPSHRLTSSSTPLSLPPPKITPNRIAGVSGTRDAYLRRLYGGVTAATSINYNAQLAEQELASACPAPNATLALDPGTATVACDAPRAAGVPLPEALLDGVKPFISRNAYALVLEVLAIDVMSKPGKPDYAIFSMHVQRSDIPNQSPDYIMWDVSGRLAGGGGRFGWLSDAE